MPRATRRQPVPAFTLIELLVCIAIVSILISILLVAVEKVRHRSYITKCAANIHAIGQALEVYANASNGNLPRTAYDPLTAATPVFGRPPGATNDVTAAFHLLAQTQRMPLQAFLCDYGDIDTFRKDPGDPAGTAQFTDYRSNLAYGFADPFPEPSAQKAGYAWILAKLPPDLALVADRSPGVSLPYDDVWAAADAGAGKRLVELGNSRNHEKDGQNVLYPDMHVTFEETPFCGHMGDHIFRPRRRRDAGSWSPVDGDDSVLLPAAGE